MEPRRVRSDQRRKDDMLQRARPRNRSMERIVTVEETAELRLDQPHVVRLESRSANAEGVGAVSVRELVRASLRMRPDRLIVGEVRGGEALDMLQACNTGHDGSLSTVHANSPADALLRLETLALYAGVALPLAAVRAQVGAGIDAIVQVARSNGGGRSVVAIAEVDRARGEPFGRCSLATGMIWSRRHRRPGRLAASAWISKERGTRAHGRRRSDRHVALLGCGALGASFCGS